MERRDSQKIAVEMLMKGFFGFLVTREKRGMIGDDPPFLKKSEYCLYC